MANILLWFFSGCDIVYLFSKVILAHWLGLTNLGEKNFMVETWYFLNFALNGYFLLFFPIFAIFAILHQFAILICWHFAYPSCTSCIQSFQYIFQSADPSAHSMAFHCFCVYVTSTSTSQIQTATAADVKLHRTSIPPCPVISLWLRAMLSQYPSFGGEVLCLHNPMRFQGKTCKFTRCQVISPRKIDLLWWHCWVTSYNHKWWLLSWRVLKRKEELKDDANLSWKILLTWEFSCLGVV